MRALILTLLVGCFSPKVPKAPCAENDACPDGEACVYGVCGGDDSDAPLIGFAASALTVDETVGTVTIPITLSKPPLRPVTVHYGVAGGTATPDVDYSTTDQTLTFDAGTSEQDVTITIVLDTLEEPDETIELQLDSPDGGLIGAGTETVTIAANLLPRASFTASAVSIPEATPGSVMVTLDNPPMFPVTVDYTISGTATGGGVDYTLAAGTLNFATGVTSQQLALGIVNDALDENDETIVLTLANPTNAFLGANPVETVTIVDDDPTPTVSITTPNGQVGEANTSVALTVTLSAVSGRTVTVPFAAGGASTATAGADYNYMTASPLTFAPGTTTQMIDIAIIDDSIGEPDETIVTTLATPTNATLGTSTQTETIIDDDRVCYGSGGSDVCLASAPTGDVVLPATINTGTSALCAATQPFGWTNAGQPAACVIAAATIEVNGTVAVTGTRPLVLVAADSITVSALLDAASHHGGSTGPGSPSAACSAFPTTPQNGNSGGGGGAGGSFMSKGGNGGSGNAGGATAGTSPAASAAPAVLHAGCDGQTAGKAGGGSTAGTPGHGGGAVYLLAVNTITIGTGGIIDVSGSAGSGGTALTGGGGAGTGGMILLDAPTINATGGVLTANGGGGASGGNSVTSGVAGGDPSPAAPLTQALGGTSGGTGGNGGAGFAGGAAAIGGAAGSANGGGGGGGGGGGYIESNVVLTGATTSAGLVQP